MNRTPTKMSATPIAPANVGRTKDDSVVDERWVNARNAPQPMTIKNPARISSIATPPFERFETLMMKKYNRNG